MVTRREEVGRRRLPACVTRAATSTTPDDGSGNGVNVVTTPTTLNRLAGSPGLLAARLPDSRNVRVSKSSSWSVGKSASRWEVKVFRVESTSSIPKFPNEKSPNRPSAPIENRWPDVLERVRCRYNSSPSYRMTWSPSLTAIHDGLPPIWLVRKPGVSCSEVAAESKANCPFTVRPTSFSAGSGPLRIGSGRFRSGSGLFRTGSVTSRPAPSCSRPRTSFSFSVIVVRVASNA